MEQDGLRDNEQHLPGPNDGDTGKVPLQDVDDYVRQHLLEPDDGDTGKVPENEAVQAPGTPANPNTYPSNCSLEDVSLTMDPNPEADIEQLLDVDSGDTGNVSKENEAGQAPVTSANPSTCPSNCSLEDLMRSLMDASIVQDNGEIQEEEMKKACENHFRRLEQKKLDVDGHGSVNVSKNEVSQASNPNNCSFYSITDGAYLRGLDKSSQSINDDNMARGALDQNQNNCSTPQNHTSSNPSNVAVNQQNEVMTMTRTPTDVDVNNAMPLMHQVEGPQSVSDVPMHQPQSIMHQFNSQLHHHSPNPTVQLSPQVPSSVHMPLPVNQFNHQQNITPPAIPVASMPITAGLVSHWPQLDHMSPAIITGLPQIPSSSPSHHAPHYSTQNHVVHLVPRITHRYMEEPIDDHTDINKRKHWSEEEHRLFLSGMQKYGKGNWKEISINVLKTRTPGQIASHAQKFFNRLENNEENNNNNNDRARKRRRSIHDIIDLYVLPEPSHHHQHQHQDRMIVSYQNQFVPSSSLPIHHQSYCPQNPPNNNNHDLFNS